MELPGIEPGTTAADLPSDQAISRAPSDSTAPDDLRKRVEDVPRGNTRHLDPRAIAELLRAELADVAARCETVVVAEVLTARVEVIAAMLADNDPDDFGRWLRFRTARLAERSAPHVTARNAS